MADKLADLSPEDKEKRIAEMKAKMQAAAAKNKAASGEPAKPAAAVPTAAAPAVQQSSGDAAIAQAAATAKTAHAVPAEAPAKVIEQSTHNAGSEYPAPVAPAAQAAAAGAVNNGAGSNGVATNGGSGNGAAVATAPMLTAPPLVYVEETPEQRAKKAMSRREFLTYAWGATLGLLALQSGVGTFFFMYPRFKAGEFGGMFFLGPDSALPATDAPPSPNTSGKFWLVNTVDEGPKALYMVCTHLGCLYKWEQSNNRFECPCHGSKFSREGYYIEGPAGRSLDTFLIAVDNGEVTVDTGKKTPGSPAADSPARAVVA